MWGRVEVGILIVMLSAAERSVKIAMSGILRKCSVWWIFLLCVFTCTILLTG